MKQHPRSRLLVSVRSAAEAEATLRAGCDLIDVKEPSRGSLGCADADVWRSVAEVIERANSAPDASFAELSLACGELVDVIADDAPLELPPITRYAKVGLLGIHQPAELRRAWNLFVDRLPQHGERSATPVPVWYADRSRAEGPSFRDVLDLVDREPDAGLLIDTASKSGPRLLDLVPLTTVGGWVIDAHARGLWIALAGRMTLADVEALKEFRPEIIGLRSAVCTSQNRQGEIDPERVARACEIVSGFSSSVRPS